MGGARLSNLSSFQRFWVTRADYQERGLARDSTLTLASVAASELTGQGEAAVA